MAFICTRYGKNQYMNGNIGRAVARNCTDGSILCHETAILGHGYGIYLYSLWQNLVHDAAEISTDALVPARVWREIVLIVQIYATKLLY